MKRRIGIRTSVRIPSARWRDFELETPIFRLIARPKGFEPLTSGLEIQTGGALVPSCAAKCRHSAKFGTTCRHHAAPEISYLAIRTKPHQGSWCGAAPRERAAEPRPARACQAPLHPTHWGLPAIAALHV